jgi:cellulose biosynthesis protein BcsQ
MKIISIFNNKGGVGKTNLTYHLAYALAETGNKVLMIDLDPQCNLTIYGMDVEKLHAIWEQEDSFIDDFGLARRRFSESEFNLFNNSPRTIHYLLKPIEEGTGDLETLTPPVKVAENLDLIPGRLTLHMYEDRIAERWNGLYRGDPLSIRTVTHIRTLAGQYAAKMKYDFTIIDTSPSLGTLNKVAISTVDGFLIPCLPDMFSLYGIRNIGNSLIHWKKDFDTIYSLISEEKRSMFPEKFVRFLGFTIYNAKKYTGVTPLNLARAAYNYAQKIPPNIKEYIKPELRDHLTEEMINDSEGIGGQSVMHTHNTLPSVAQKYRNPIWKIPSLPNLEPEDVNTIRGNKAVYEKTREGYINFAEDLLKRIRCLDN